MYNWLMYNLFEKNMPCQLVVADYRLQESSRPEQIYAGYKRGFNSSENLENYLGKKKNSGFYVRKGTVDNKNNQYALIIQKDVGLLRLKPAPSDEFKKYFPKED